MAGAVSCGTEVEDAPHHCGGLLIHYQLLSVLRVLAAAIGRSGPQPLPTLRLGPEHCPHLTAGVPDIPLVEQVLEGHQFIALTAVGVHIVVDGDVADTKHREPFFDVKTGMQLVPPKAGEIFGDDDPDLAVFHVGDHLLEARSLEAGPGIAIIYIKAGIVEAMIPCILL